VNVCKPIFIATDFLLYGTIFVHKETHLLQLFYGIIFISEFKLLDLNGVFFHVIECNSNVNKSTWNFGKIEMMYSSSLLNTLSDDL